MVFVYGIQQNRNVEYYQTVMKFKIKNIVEIKNILVNGTMDFVFQFLVLHLQVFLNVNFIINQ
jgi:hypothetical protein